jgi:GGDEF domain-containing protein
VIAQDIGETRYTSQNIRSGVSIGISFYPQNGVTEQELILASKEALFNAQRLGGSGVSCSAQIPHQEEEVS